jgi:hypothetical protein
MKFLTVAALAGAAVAYPGSKSKKDHSGVFKAIIERAGERLLERQGKSQLVLVTESWQLT